MAAPASDRDATAGGSRKNELGRRAAVESTGPTTKRARRPCTDAFHGAHRIADSHRLLRCSFAIYQRENPGALRIIRFPAGWRRRRAADAPSAVAGKSAGAGHARPSWILEEFL